MTIDFHTHGKLTKKLPFSSQYTQWLFQEAANAGLDAICLTEHFNTFEFDKLYQYVHKELPRVGDCFLFSSLKIFAGMEIDVQEGGHITAIGSMEHILLLHRKLEAHMKKGSFLPLGKALDLLKELPLLMGMAHPFREGGHIPELPEELLGQFTFVELNGKDVAAHREATETLTRQLGKRLRLPVVAGSDTHQSLQYGCIYNQMAQECYTVEQLRCLIEEGGYQIHISDHCGMQVRAAGILKRTLKEIHGLGGDYMSVIGGMDE